MTINLQSKLKKIKCFITDIDGVLSDGRLYLSKQGDEIKTFHVHDGVGLKLLMHAGIQVAVITASNNQIIDKRMQQLGIKHYYKGQLNKRDAYLDLKKRLNITDETCAYVGDDVPDLVILDQVGFAATVSDARPEVKHRSDFTSNFPGGHGAIREIADLIIHTQQVMDQALESYLDHAIQ